MQFAQIFYRFSGIFIEKTTFEEFVEICKQIHTVKPLIKNTSEEFIKCRLDNFSKGFMLYYVNFSICENK